MLLLQAADKVDVQSEMLRLLAAASALRLGTSYGYLLGWCSVPKSNGIDHAPHFVQESNSPVTPSRSPHQGSRTIQSMLWLFCVPATLQHCRMLHVCHQAATRLGKLQELLLSGCGGITLSAVRGFPALTFLDLSYCEALLPASAVRRSPFAMMRHK